MTESSEPSRSLAESSATDPSRPLAGSSATAPSLFRSPFFYATLLGLIGIPLLYLVLPRRIPKPPPVLGQLPAFVLQDQEGKPFGLEQMKGSVSVVSFFFTRCPTICPRLMGQVAKLQRRYEQAQLPMRLVSISVDPEHDHSVRLRSYGQRLRADFKRWRFLTGPQKKIYALAEAGFLTAVNTQKERPSVMELTHTEKLILIDQRGQIRGYYESSDLGIDEVFHRSIHVLRQRNLGR